jgi:hypothetical protein
MYKKEPDIIVEGQEWTVHIDDETGKHFLYNELTCETKWATEEEELVFQQHAMEKNAVQFVPEKHVDDEALKIKYDLSEILHAIGLDIEKDKELHWIGYECKAALESPSLPHPWSEVIYEAEGSVYYHNILTNATSWDHPALQIYIDKVFETKKLLNAKYAKAINFCENFRYKKIFQRLKKILKQRQKINRYASHYSSTSLMRKCLTYWRKHTHQRKTTKYKYKMFYFRKTVSKVFSGWHTVAIELGNQNPTSRIVCLVPIAFISSFFFNYHNK